MLKRSKQRRLDGSRSEKGECMSAVQHDGSVVTLTSPDIRLMVSSQDGRIVGLELAGASVINVGGQTGLGFEVNVEGFRAEPRLTACEIAPEGETAAVSLAFTTEDGSRDARTTRRYKITHEIALADAPPRLERRLWIERQSTGDLTGATPDRLRSATLSLAGLALGDAQRTFFSFPMFRVPPGSPLSALRGRPRFFPLAAAIQRPTADSLNGHYDAVLTAPDCAVGCLLLEDRQGRHVSIVPATREYAVWPRLFHRDGICFEHEFCCSTWMDLNDRVLAASQTILLRAGDEPRLWQQALPETGRLVAALFPPVADSPPWANNAVICELEPRFMGGFAALSAKLDGIRELGATAIYLMPWHQGWYRTRDYYTPEAELGSSQELKDLIRRAHDNGLRVLFDLLVSIVAPDSPLVCEHPDFFYRDLRGRPRAHLTWGSRCLDPASPGFRTYLTDYARWCVAELGCDGFRVDAAAHRGANWNNLPGVTPHEHSHALFTLLGEVRQSIRSINPDAILMAESFGPVQAPISDLVGYAWIFTIDWLMQELEAGRIRGSDLQRFIAEQTMAMPAGTRLCYYSHTHDTLPYTKRDRRGPLPRAYFASLAMLGPGVMYFAGGWGMLPRPEADEADQYRRLFAFRRGQAGFHGFDTDFPPSPGPDVFLFRKTGCGRHFLFATNFSGGEVRVPLPGDMVFSRTEQSSANGGDLRLAPYDTVVMATHH